MAVSTGASLMATLVAAMAWGHGASILVLETLKRALTPANRQRDILVAQALKVSLPQKLLQLLDWRRETAIVTVAAGGGDSGSPSGAAADAQHPASANREADISQSNEQEQAVQRALAVDVLRLLAEEGLYSSQVQSLLGQSPVWSAYKDQRHDMFLPSGATVETGVVGLLTAGETTIFALPAPETVQGSS
eukprot:GHRR01009122.1.p1 GENE.GHRR01009122.1~~GHRR01009122.1.p1  ORF type:complete len:191 (+),score=72.01 GHRR01009122.1:177-749(+)